MRMNEVFREYYLKSEKRSILFKLNCVWSFGPGPGKVEILYLFAFLFELLGFPEEHILLVEFGLNLPQISLILNMTAILVL